MKQGRPYLQIGFPHLGVCVEVQGALAEEFLGMGGPWQGSSAEQNDGEWLTNVLFNFDQTNAEVRHTVLLVIV